MECWIKGKLAAVCLFLLYIIEITLISMLVSLSIYISTTILHSCLEVMLKQLGIFLTPMKGFSTLTLVKDALHTQSLGKGPSSTLWGLSM